MIEYIIIKSCFVKKVLCQLILKVAIIIINTYQFIYYIIIVYYYYFYFIFLGSWWSIGFQLVHGVPGGPLDSSQCMGFLVVHWILVSAWVSWWSIGFQLVDGVPGGPLDSSQCMGFLVVHWILVSAWVQADPTFI